jgi:hypothetical protein
VLAAWAESLWFGCGLYTLLTDGYLKWRAIHSDSDRGSVRVVDFDGELLAVDANLVCCQDEPPYFCMFTKRSRGLLFC